MVPLPVLGRIEKIVGLVHRELEEIRHALAGPVRN
jgi:hypothetical protein